MAKGGMGNVRKCERKKIISIFGEGCVRIKKINRFDYADAKSDSDVYRVCLPYGFISEQLSDEVVNWNNEESVFIAADTGLGKNTFVEQILIPKIRELGGKILLLSNRVALGRQEKRRLAKIFNMEEILEDYTDTGLDKLIKFGCLTVVSYQQLGAWINENSAPLKEVKKEFFDFVIMDEVHFFLGDCSFNPLTDIILKFIIENFQNSVRLYMTATPEQIFPVLKQKDIKLVKEQNEFIARKRNWMFYEFVHDFSWIQPKAFADLNDLADIIRQNQGKWLIFVDSIAMGNELKDLLGEGVLLTAESKNPEAPTYPVFSQIVKRERCNERVIIATSVLENGINLKDSELKNVVIFSNEKMQFMQMLGRVRRMAGCLTLYIPDVSHEQILKRLQRINAIDRAIQVLKNDATKFYQEYLLPENPPVKIKNSVTLLKNHQMHSNSLFKLKTLVYDYPFWNDMYERSKNGEEFVMLKEKFSWIEKEFQAEDFVSRKEYEKSHKNLISFLEQKVGTPIMPEKKEMFAAEFSKLFKAVYGARNVDKSQDQVYGLNIIKKCLNEQNLPFTVINNKNQWTVEKIEK